MEKIETLQKRSGAAAKSEVIRHALKEFDFSSVQIEPKSSKQISVRLSTKAKRDLLRASKKLKISVGELLRLSVEALPKRIAAGSLVSAAATAPKKKTVKKAAKQAAKRLSATTTLGWMTLGTSATPSVSHKALSARSAANRARFWSPPK